jgi:CHAT domain-containing protein/tetratricopeptide (TPR) repeat protein
MRGRFFWLLVGVGLVVAVLGWWLAGPARARRTAGSGDLDRLVAAAGSTRFVEPRLTGGFPWAAWPPRADASAQQARDRAESLILSAAADMQRRHASRRQDVAIESALGRARLLIGEVEAAISTLDARMARAPDAPAASGLNDLAAAHLVKGLTARDAEHVLQALDSIERALEAAPSLLEARFNRALALEFLGPSSRAVAAWDDYLQHDRSSSWAGEAKQHRDRLAARVADATAAGDRARQQGRQYVEEELLLGWAQAVGRGDATAAAEALAHARTAAAEAPQSSTDSYLRDLVALVERAADGRSREIAQAYRDGQEARRQIVELNQVDSARALLTSAKKQAGTGGPLGEYLQYWWLLTEWYRGRPETLEAPLRALIQTTDRAKHGYLEARSRVLLGSVLHRLTRYSDAIESYQRGVDELAALDERDAEAANRMLLAGALRDHALWRDAWRNELAALDRLDSLKAFAARHNVIREAVRLALARRQAEVAAVYVDMLDADARAWGDPGALLTVAMYRSRVEFMRGRTSAAAAGLAEADRRFEAIQDPSFKQSYRLDLVTLRAQVLTASNPELAVSAAQTLIADATASGAIFRRVEAYRMLGRAAAAAGRVDQAIDAWRQGIAALEDDDLRVREERARIARTNDVWGIYDDLVRALVGQQRPAEALAVAERGRSRVLLETASQNTGAIGPLVPITTADLPNVVVYYVTLADRTLIWVLHRGARTYRESAGGAAAVAGFVKAIDAAAQTHDDPTEALRGLYRLLMTPVADLLPSGAAIAIVPDGALSSVPFAALVSPESGRFLVEDREISVSPSLELLQLATARLRLRPLVVARALAAGDAAPSGDNMDLPPLPGARREAEAIARVYQSEPLVGASLSPAAFLARVRSSDVVHFAGHAVADSDYPSRSFLALAGTGDAARLTPDRITADVFGRVQLVVLSACSTAGGDVARGEGVLSLARPFLAAGIPFVLATLQPVDDGIGPLLVDFHERLRAGQAPAQALRLAQLHAIEQDRAVNLRGWAAFTLFGGLPASR